MIYKIRGEIFFDEFFLKKKIKGGEIKRDLKKVELALKILSRVCGVPLIKHQT